MSMLTKCMFGGDVHLPITRRKILRAKLTLSATAAETRGDGELLSSRAAEPLR